MAVYFSGTRQVGNFSILLESGHARVDVVISERWEDTDITSIARCGELGYCEVEKSEGLSEKSLHNLKGVVESTLGVEGLASLKSQIEEIIGYEVQWNKNLKITKRFEHSSPKCGRKVITIYELRREFELTYLRLRRVTWRNDVWDKKWTRIMKYETNKHDALPDIEEYDELCNCPNQKYSEYDGRLCFDLGNVSFRVPYRLKEGGFDVQIFDTVVSFTFNEFATGVRALDEGVNILIPTDIIPEVLIFLGDIEGANVEAKVYRYLDIEEMNASLGAVMASISPEQVTFSQARTQFLEK